MLEYRSLTPSEALEYYVQCKVIKDNQMQCERKVSRFVICDSVVGFLCEGHFQVLRQTAAASGEEISDLSLVKTEVERTTEP